MYNDSLRSLGLNESNILLKPKKAKVAQNEK